jgi:microsomal dipeptidase-like Zn-dependent dipeptidase
MNKTYVDLHCHPAMKPYGKSFNLSTPGDNNKNTRKENSLWFYNPPSVADKLLNYIGGLTKFSQANVSSLGYGNVKVVCASLYPMEKWFVNNKLGTGAVADVLENLAIGVGKKRINFIQGITDYFADLEREYNFYKQLNGQQFDIDEGQMKYIIAKNYNDIEVALQADEIHHTTTICFVMTIEGLHVLNTGLAQEPDPAQVLANLDTIKSWEHKPFFVTFAHHFWNHLCGHARSLTGLVAKQTDQSENLNTGFTELGWKVLKKLLDNKDGKRILVDVKHMSALSRRQYFEKLRTEYADQHIPVIMSHGAANGLRSMDEQVVDMKDTGFKLLQEDINFYDEEILIMAKSNGLIGLQLDERRIASANTLSNTKHSMFRNKIMHYRSELLWNQVQHIAELLDKHGLFAWANIGIGSDYDGVIDPLNAFWTEEEMPFLADFLERHANNYMEGRGQQVLQPFNRISPNEIITRIFTDNAMAVMKQHFV